MGNRWFFPSTARLPPSHAEPRKRKNVIMILKIAKSTGGNMSESIKTDCKDPAGHWRHLCELRKQGREEEFKDLMQDPGHTCLNCNAVAKHAQNLCNPSPIIKI
jgi:hypothetical protein